MQRDNLNRNSTALASKLANCVVLLVSRTYNDEKNIQDELRKRGLYFGILIGCKSNQKRHNIIKFDEQCFWCFIGEICIRITLHNLEILSHLLIRIYDLSKSIFYVNARAFILCMRYSRTFHLEYSKPPRSEVYLFYSRNLAWRRGRMHCS